jgi:hypothetical protein
MMADGSLLRSGGETGGRCRRTMLRKQVSLPVDSLDSRVAAETEQVERTRRKTWSPA